MFMCIYMYMFIYMRMYRVKRAYMHVFSAIDCSAARGRIARAKTKRLTGFWFDFAGLRLRYSVRFT